MGWWIAAEHSGGAASGRIARGIGVAVLLLGLAAPAGVRAETGTIDLHFEGGGATFVRAPQTGYFGFGGAAAAAFEWSILDLVGLELEYLFAGFPQGDGPFSRPDGQVHLVGAGFRLRPWNDTGGFAGHVGEHPDWHEGNWDGDLWISAHAGWVRTGGLDRFGFDAALGYELSLIDGFSLGPYARYLHVVQPDDEPLDPADALALSFGLAGTFCLTSCSVHVPPPDSDGDGLNDRVDACPREAEDPDAFEDEDGCPEPDNDGDGIPDPVDDCPLEPEDLDGHHDEDGCPEPEVDSDGDTLLDEDDPCPTEAEDPDAFEDEDGCPEPDNDGDGFPDGEDDCPNEAEVINGVDDDDGCPDQALVHVEHDRIVLEDMVHFEFGTAVLRSGSRPVLEDVARLLLAHPEYEHVSIEGYADQQGSREFNQGLSERRAERIRETLIRMGVAPERLSAQGFGETNPLEEAETLEAFRQNRRVEFVITRVRR